MKKFSGMLVSVLLVFVLVLSACSTKNANNSSSSSPNSEGTASPAASGDDQGTTGKKLKIAIVPKLIGIPYFNASETGALKAGTDLGVEVIYTGPTQADAAQQVKVIEDLISRKVDVIAVAPNDPASLTPVLKKAKEQGIKIMDWDTPADQSVVELSIQQIDNEVFGRAITDKLVEKMGSDTGEYAIVTGGLSAANLNTWIDWAQKQATEKYPGLKLVTDKIASDEKQQIAYQKTLDLLKAYPNLKGIMAFSTVAPLGAAQAVKEKGLEGKVAVVGTALPTDSKPYLVDGSLSSALLWDPGALGYLTVALAKDLAEGKMPADGQDVPNVGKIQVKSDKKTIIMGPPTEFTKENADQFKF
ncbi:periplasmic binding protein [Paenibacillus baekrokdamisoli]|uniref:Periplasmic binding protein n=1 Tax=Paenibacillus baekrokdamisoli TaxID=1712516 RepID=A0A3G9ILF6_9BACL|nr:autoinducer 2 ABC transporter substrate-binding protein [Paenibacillus baekrokdamisoli]MBB3067786.1 simple sugar transport system substrate-binding protein/rhamnose transport system substrate-binding protein [Paenibacillus baekrokdamisoli]BBH19032.1 periplasmic binding protein [Paenibacillus baekrokdamisoli]